MFLARGNGGSARSWHFNMSAFFPAPGTEQLFAFYSSLKQATMGRSGRLAVTAASACWIFVLRNSQTLAFSPSSLHHSNPHVSSSQRHQISRSASTHTVEDVAKEKPHVQRYYESFSWNYNDEEYNINYRVEGPNHGAPILLVHGFGANVNHFRFQFPALVEKGYRVYAVDLLGFGASDKPNIKDYCIELFAELLVDFIQANRGSKDEKWVVAGNSIGGLCSLAVATEIPELIKAVVLFNCSGGMTGFRYQDVSLYVRPLLWFVQKVVLGETFGGQFFQNFKTRENVESILRQQGVYGNATNVDEELIEILLGPAEDDGAEQVFLTVIAGPPGPTPESLLPNVKCPTLALWGTQDPWTPMDGGMHPGTSFGNFTDEFTLIPLDGVGHCPHDECPDLVNSNMIEWLKGLDQRET